MSLVVVVLLQRCCPRSCGMLEKIANALDSDNVTWAAESFVLLFAVRMACVALQGKRQVSLSSFPTICGLVFV